MALTAHPYTKLVKSLVDKLADLDSDALKVALLSAYTVGTTQDDAQFVADVITGGVATEVANGNGYTTGGAALAGVTLVEAGHVYTLDCNDVTWAASTISAVAALFYDSTPGAYASDPVICFWDFGQTVSSTNGTFTLTISASGLLVVTGT